MQSNNHRLTRMFSLMEIAIVIAIVTVIFSIVLSVFASARLRSQSVVCLSNIRQVGVAAMMYSQDYDGHLPWGGDPLDKYTTGWSGSPNYPDVVKMKLLRDVLYPYLKSNEVWKCPCDNGLMMNVFSEGQGLKSHSTIYGEFGMSYLYNTRLALINRVYSGIYGEYGGVVFYADEVWLFLDGNGVWHGGENNEKWNVYFVDGHCGSVDKARMRTLNSIVFK